MMNDTAFRAEWDRQYVASVRRAVEHTFRIAAHHEPNDVYRVLTAEFRRRGVQADASAVYGAAMLISRGRKPPVLRD